MNNKTQLQHLNLFLGKRQGYRSPFSFDFEFRFYSKGLVERVTAALVLCVCLFFFCFHNFIPK